MGDGFAHRLEIRPCPFHLLSRAANHNAQRALGRALAPPANGRIEHVCPFGGEFGRHFFGRLGADGAVVYHQCAGANALQHPVFAQNDSLHVGGIADTNEDDVALGGQIGRGGGRGGSLSHKGGSAFGRAVPQPHRKPRLLQVGYHAPPHNTKSNKADCFCCHGAIL